MKYCLLLFSLYIAVGCSSSNPSRSLASQSMLGESEDLEQKTFFQVKQQKQKDQASILATWNNTHFDLVEKYQIEISSDDQNYILHGETAGDSRTSIYSYNIELPELGIYFIRLKAVNKYGFSETISTQRIDIK